jgi:RNA polymerase sigma-70 factor (ECF subfamily)
VDVSPIDLTIERYLGLYDDALPQVYGYVARRVDSTVVAEDVTAETFLSAMATIKKGTAVEPSIGWLIGVARHKVADHWRRQAREERRLTKAANQHEVDSPGAIDQWDELLDAQLAHATLAELSVNHRAALSLRYLDGLPVGEVAHHLGRSVGATEALLTRAKAAFRIAYPSANETGVRHA